MRTVDRFINFGVVFLCITFLLGVIWFMFFIHWEEFAWFFILQIISAIVISCVQYIIIYEQENSRKVECYMCNKPMRKDEAIQQTEQDGKSIYYCENCSGINK